MAAEADAGSRHHDAILTVASVDLPYGLSRRRGAGDVVHGQPAGLADEQAAQQIAMPGIVAEREFCVARELGLRLFPCPLVDQRWHRNGDPLLARLEATPGRGGGARTTLDGRLVRRHVGVAVGIGGAGVDRVGQDVVDRGGRPGGATGARQVWAGVEAFSTGTTYGRPTRSRAWPPRSGTGPSAPKERCPKTPRA